MSNENKSESTGLARSSASNPSKRRLSFVFFCLGGLLILPLGLLAIASHLMTFEIPKRLDAIVGPTLFFSFLAGIICLAVGAKLIKLGK
jgi:hypothetical protein